MKIEHTLVSIFPGSDENVTMQEIVEEIRAALKRIEQGDFEELDITE